MVDVKKDINYSTKYCDRVFIEGSLSEKLIHLSDNLNSEITLSCHCPIKLDRLADRYLADAEEAKVEGAFGYVMRYMTAFRRIQILEHSLYRAMPPITIGKISC